MLGVLSAEPAVLVEHKAVGIVLLVLHSVVIALLAFGAGKGDFDAHVIDLLRLRASPRPMN
jgi:hypothetical protein